MATSFVACDNGTEGTPPITVAGGGNVAGSGNLAGSGQTAGTSSSAGSSSAGATGSVEGVPITPADGWVDGASNALGIEGAFYSYADTTSSVGLVGTFTGPTGCISGTAAQVMDPCTVVAPATDCFGTYWGAAMGLNLHQPKDPATGKGVETPLAYDASMLKGFAFEVTGDMVPGSKDLRFKVEDASGEFCTPVSKKVLTGTNTVLFTELLSKCWDTSTAQPNADTVKSGLLKIAWAVVTRKDAAIPFNFCVSNIRALMKDGAVIPMGGAGSGAGGASSAGGSSAGGSTSAAGSSAAGSSSGGASAGAASGGTGGSSGGSAGKGGTGG